MGFNRIIAVIGLSLLSIFQLKTKAQAPVCATSYDNPWEWASHATWFTGQGVFINFPGGTGAPVVTTKAYALGDNTNHAYEGTAAFSDNAGNLIGWSNGRKLWRDDGADGVLVADDLVAGNENGSVGQRSSAVQGIVAVRHPNIPEKIFIFTSDDVLSSDIGPHYVVYDITTETSTPPVRLQNDVGANYRSSEQIDATFHANGNDIWVVIRQSGRGSYNNFRSFYSYLITCDGLNPVPVKSNEVVPETGHHFTASATRSSQSWTNDYGRGALKISWDGTKAATGNHITGGNDSDESLMVFDFDNATGLLSNAIPFARVTGAWNFDNAYTNWGAAYDVEWAPDSRGLYVSSINGSGQLQWFDTGAGSSAAINSSGKIVTGTLTQFRDIKLGGDGNLYATGSGSTLRQYAFPSVAALNAGNSVTVNNIPTGNTVSLGLSNTFIPPIDYITLSSNPTTANCTDAPINLSVEWVCRGGDAEDPTVSGWSSTCGPCITDAANGIFDPSIAGVGTHEVYYSRGTACSQIDTLEITVSCGPCEDTTLANVIPPICINETSDLTTFEVTGDPGSWSIVGTPAGSSPATITGGNLFDASSADPGTYRIRYTLSSAPISACPDSAERDIVVNGLPDISLSAGPICDGETEVLDAGNPGSTYKWFTGGIAGGTAQTESVTTAGPHKVIVTLASGCVDSAETTVTVNANPDVSITVPSVSCDNESSEVLSATPSGGTWYINDVLSITGSFDPGALGASTHKIKYEYTDANGCSDIDSIDHDVNAAPSVSIDPISVSCSNEAVETMTASPVGGTWRIDGVSSTDAFDPSVHTGASTVRYTYTNGDGCTDSTELAVNINIAPDVTIDPISVSCDNEAAETMTASPSGGNWFINDAASTDSFDPSALGAATHEVKYRYTDGSGCSDSDSVDVTINAAPSVSIDPISVSCSNEAVETMTASPSGGSWRIDGVSSTDAFDPSVHTGASTVRYTYTNGDGCTDSTELAVNINIAPDVTIDPISASCDNHLSETMTASPSGGNWYINDVASTDVFDPMALGASTHEVKYSYTDGSGCSDSDSVDVTINAIPVVTATIPAQFCQNEGDITFTGSPVGGDWVVNGSAASSPFAATDGSIGNNDVEYIYVDGNGCTDTARGSVDILSPPTARIDASNTVWCTNADVTLTGEPTTGVTYTWSGDGLSSTDPVVTVAGEGPFQLIVEDGNTCKDTTDISFTAQLPNPDLGEDQNVCTGFETTLDPGVFVSYLWDDASTDPTRDVVAGFGYYWVEVTDAEGCTNRDSVEFTERHPFTVEIEGDTVICEYETATLTAVETPDISGGTYEWVGAIGSSETGYATSAGLVKVIVTDDANCTDSAEVTITVNERPDASFALNVDSFCSVGKETYQVVLMVDGDSSTVNYGDDYYTFTDAGDQETNRATYNYAPTVVYGSFTDTNGCMSTDTLALMEYCEPTDIQLPNVFVPGGGVTGNTTFRPINMNDENFIEIVNNIQWSDFVVYNRWGLKVFQSKNLIPNWDGMFENQPVASGTYYWIFKYKDSSMKEYSYNGFVQVVQQLD